MIVARGWSRRWAALVGAAALGSGALSLSVASPAQAAPFVTGVVVDAAGRPLNGATVNVYPATDVPGQSPFRALSVGYTDPDGTFKVDTQGATSVKVAISGPNGGPGYEYVGEWYNDKPTREAADAISPGDLGVIALASPGSISGVVRDAAGAPIEGVNVRASLPSSYSYYTSTDATGAYTFTGLVGTYNISFLDYDQNDERTSQDYARVDLPTPVVVGAGVAVTGVDAVMTPTGYVPAGVDLTGRVVDGAGAPQVGDIVRAYAVGPRLRDKELLDSAATNRLGVYNFTGLDTAGATQVRLEVLSIDSGLNAFPRTPTWSGNQYSYLAAVPVGLVPGGVAVAPDIAMTVMGGIRGTIASDATGPTNAGSLQLYNLNGEPVQTADGFITGVRTRVDGTYELKGVEPGSYLLRFDGTGLAPEWSGNAASWEKAKTVVVKPGEFTLADASLATGLAVLEDPEVKGLPIVGKPISVTTGVWNQQDESNFSYEWLANGVVVGTEETFTPTAALVGQRLQARVTNKPVEQDSFFRVYQPASVTVATYKVGFATKLKVKAKAGKAAITVTNQKVKAKKIKGTVTAQLLDSEGNLTKSFGKAKIKKGKGSMSLTKLLKKAKGDRKKVVFTFVAKTKKVGAAVLNAKVKKLKKK